MPYFPALTFVLTPVTSLSYKEGKFRPIKNAAEGDLRSVPKFLSVQTNLDFHSGRQIELH